jgi:hypothetical protein
MHFEHGSRIASFGGRPAPPRGGGRPAPPPPRKPAPPRPAPPVIRPAAPPMYGCGNFQSGYYYTTTPNDPSCTRISGDGTFGREGDVSIEGDHYDDRDLTEFRHRPSRGMGGDSQSGHPRFGCF